MELSRVRRAPLGDRRGGPLGEKKLNGDNLVNLTSIIFKDFKQN